MSAQATVEKRREMNSTDDETRTFRGRTLEEVLPQIKADLGPDAEIVRQREGLTGGVGGFFQRPCIEVDARAGEPIERPRPSGRRFDAYDDEPAMPEPYTPDLLPDADEPTAEGLATPGIQEILRQAAPFADHLNAASLDPKPKPARHEFEPLVESELEMLREEQAQAAHEPEPEPEPQRRPPEVREQPRVQEPRVQPLLAARTARPQVADAIETQLGEAGI